MGGVVFSVTLSVSVAAAFMLFLKGPIVRRYGFKMINILTLIMAVRLIIPYSIQVPGIPVLRIAIPWYVPVIWAAGAVICLIVNLGKYIYLAKNISKSCKPVDDVNILAQYDALKQKMFIDKEIPLLISTRAGSPMLFGFFRPCIVLTVHGFSEGEMEMVLRHELTHYRNRDSLKKLFFSFVAAVQWFNPFVWLIMREYCCSLECMCDEAVTKEADTKCKKEYCYMLLKTGGQSRSLIAPAAYFSAKEMLKMRIDSVFEGKKKKMSGTLVTLFTVCLAILSGFLCACTVETPDDVKEDMSHVESGVENEKEAGGQGTEEAGPVSVSKAVSEAEQTIEEWSRKDGIFKFDNCNVIVPQVSEFPVYECEINAGIDTPEKKYEQFKEMEKELFGEGYFDEQDFIIVPADQSEAGEDVFRVELTLEEYLSGKDPRAVLLNSKDGSSIENFYSRVSYYTKYLSELNVAADGKYVFDDAYFVKRYECLNAQESELTDEYELFGGTATVAEAVACAEEAMDKYKYTVDENINYKTSAVDVYDKGDGTYAFEIFMQAYYGDIPFVSMAKNYDNDTDEINLRTGYLDSLCELTMVRCGEVDRLVSSYSNTALVPSGSKTEKILSVNQVLELLKDKFSNSIVYDIEEFKLGYDVYPTKDNTDGQEMDDMRTVLLYDVTMKTINSEIHVSIDAVTGKMNILKNNIGSL